MIYQQLKQLILKLLILQDIYIARLKYNFYFQYTITGYGSSIERNVPQKKVSIETFKELSTNIGKDKVVWRYDPIFISNDFSLELQLDNYMSIYDEIKDYTEECVISFIDIYYKSRKRIGDMRQLTEDEMIEFARKIPKADAYRFANRFHSLA